MGHTARWMAALAATWVALACGSPTEDASEPPPPVGTTAPPEPSGEPVGAGERVEAAQAAQAAEAAQTAEAEVGLADEGLDADLLAPPVAGEPEMRIVPLESLLRAPAPKPPPRVLDLRDPEERAAGGSQKPAEKGVADAVRDRVRLERRSERIGRVGPEQGTYSETEAGVDVPVGEGVKLRGGVRVEERDEPAEESRERESTPQVGVEIEF